LGANQEAKRVKIVFVIGLLLVALGIVSLFVPLPHKETHGFKAGDFSISVQTHDEEKVSPVVSAVLIAGGVGMIILGSRSRR
jgi:hypothetical protein